MRLATALAALGLLCSTVSVDAGSRMDAGSPTDSAEPPFIVPTLPDRQCRSPLLSGSPDQLIVNTFDELVSFWHGMMGDLYDRKPLMALHSTDTGQTAPPAPSGGTGAVVTVLAWADLQPLSPDGVPLEYRHWKFRGDHTLPGWADADYPGHPGRPGLLKVPPIDSRTGNGFGPPNPSVTRPWTKFVPFINFEFFHFNNPHIPYRMIEWNDAAYNKWLGMANNDLFAEVIVLAHEFGHYMQLVGGRIEIPELTGPLSDNPYDPIGEIASHGYYEPDADRLAGVFLRHLLVAGKLTNWPSCLNTASWIVYQFGDKPGAKQTGLNVSHRSPEERADCLRYGALMPIDTPAQRAENPLTLADSDKLVDCKKIRSRCTPHNVGVQRLQHMQVAGETTASTENPDSPYCGGEPEPKIGPPIAAGGARCVSNVFERWQNCVCPPGMPVRDEITGRGPDRDPAHDLIWCRRGKPRM